MLQLLAQSRGQASSEEGTGRMESIDVAGTNSSATYPEVEEPSATGVANAHAANVPNTATLLSMSGGKRGNLEIYAPEKRPIN